jgi:hypothetical protein
MAKTQTLGTKLYVESTTPGTYTAVGRLTSVGVPGPTKSEIDATDFDSTAEEALPGLPSFGSFDFSGNFDGVDAGQTALFTDAQDANAPVRNFRIDFTRQSIRFSFSGFVLSFRPSAGSVNGVYTFDGSIRVTGSVTKGAISP